MILIHAVSSKQGICEVISKGHAEYAEPGSDIICAAVSALMINTANSLEQFTEDDLTVDEDQKNGGYLRIALNGTVSDKAQLLMKSLCLGLQSIQETYGNEFVKLEFTNRT